MKTKKIDYSSYAYNGQNDIEWDNLWSRILYSAYKESIKPNRQLVFEFYYIETLNKKDNKTNGQ